MIHIKPKAGLRIRDPLNPQCFLPPEGQQVPKSAFWVRRLRDGDVEIIKPAAAITAPVKTEENI